MRSKGITQYQSESQKMSSVTNPGTNYLGSNPLGQKVRNLESQVDTLKKVVEMLVKNMSAAGSASVATAAGVPGPAGPPGPAFRHG